MPSPRLRRFLLNGPFAVFGFLLLISLLGCTPGPVLQSEGSSQPVPGESHPGNSEHRTHIESSPATQDSTSYAPEDFETPENAEELHELARRRIRLLDHCYREYREPAGLPPGAVIMKWTVLPGGAIRDVEFLESDFSHPPLERCLEEVVTSWTLPLEETSAPYRMTHRAEFRAPPERSPQPQRRPPADRPELACTSHDDCVIVRKGPDCCTGCRELVVNRQVARERATHCANIDALTCPPVGCAYRTVDAAVCDDGQCRGIYSPAR